MPKRVQRIGHETAQAAAFTGLEREITVDLGLKTTRVHDGITPGGVILAKQDLSNSPIAVGGSNDGKMSAGQATELTDATAKNVVQDAAIIASGVIVFLSNTAGSSVAYTINLGISAYTVNAVYRIVAHTANTGNLGCTLSIDSIGALSIKTITGNRLIAGQFNGSMQVMYNGVDFILLNPVNVVAKCSVRLLGQIALTQNLTTDVLYDTVISDNVGGWNAITKRFSTDILGVYTISATTRVSGTSGANYTSTIRAISSASGLSVVPLITQYQAPAKSTSIFMSLSAEFTIESELDLIYTTILSTALADFVGASETILTIARLGA